MVLSEIEWLFAEFDKLKSGDLYKLLKIRQDIFIVEQNCTYKDIDDLDYDSYHLLGYHKKRLASYLRIVPPGKKFTEPSIGRITVDENYRGKGLGRELVQLGITHTMQLYTGKPIRIEAQADLQKFYEDLNFKRVSDPYDIDKIPHIQMLLKTSA